MRLDAKNSFDRTFYVVEYKPALNLIDTHWEGYASLHDLKTACEVGLQILETTHCPYKLNDNSALSGPWSEAVSWLEDNWLPRAMQAGLKYLAHVANEHTFSEVAGEVMHISKIGQELKYRMFFKREEAIEWLQSCQAVEAAQVLT
ncbi:hypothetical protein GU926_15825 [Nibribacter ruber]|uniref:STAS/SEC14 domain-containing protein n=1 Tax=Nibribacter ruber TaxID=2698458 RepID=A0A6P1P359_9BACT|nr:hypothetical protein [Nibribacter ruber]QHL88813.1 hypothetical protein GU926_15825 [Nibribacter ruber]